ncbi:hypothetical protein, partial [Aeromonas veronii]|uniref:hypothetical protein n=1 Tax=Aeromonas veronii TaxID=654 RepID=UPI00406C72BC
DKYAEETASRMGRGKPNIEDQFRCALAILGGLEVSDPTDADDFKIKINKQLKSFLDSLLETEGGIATAITARRIEAESILQTFLLSFAT